MIIRKLFILLACAILSIDNLFAGAFKNSVASSEALSGLKPFIDTLVYLGLGIGMLSVVWNFMLGKSENPLRSALKWIIALAVYSIVSLVLF